MSSRNKRTHQKLLGAVALLSLGLTACGGGGGDSPAYVQSQNDAPAQAFALTSDNADTAMGFGASVGDAVLALAKLTAVQTVQAVGSAATSSSCANGGIVQTSWAIGAENAQRVSGDTLTIKYRDCAIAQTGSILTGTVLISILSKSDNTLTMGVDYGSGLLLVDQADQSQSYVLGTMNVTWSDDGLTRQIAVASSSKDDLRITGSYQRDSEVVQDTEQARLIDIRQTLSRERARVVTSLNFQLQSVYLGGSLNVSTPVALASYFDTYPDSGEIHVRASGQAVAKLKANYVIDSNRASYAFDVNGDGVAEDQGYAEWGQLTTGVIWWGEDLGAQSQFAAGSARPFLSNDFRILKSPFSTGVMSQLPSMAIQFSRELDADSLPRLQLVRTNYDYGNPNIWGDAVVPLTLQVKGAYLLLTPSQPLQHGVTYMLQAVNENGGALGAILYRDSMGNMLSDSMYRFTVDASLSAAITFPFDVPLLTRIRPVTLSAASSQSTNGIVSYRWTQVNGVGVTFSDPDKPTTTVTLNDGVVGNASVTVQLQITDVNGQVEYARKTITVISEPESTNLLYFRSQPGDYVGQGLQQVIPSPAGDFAGYAGPTYLRFASNTPGGWSLDLSGGGVPIRVGSYENATRAPFNGSGNGVSFSGDGRGCNSVTGRFDVLEVVYDGSGKVARLAVDFEQHCEGGSAALFGSLRYKSALPVRP